LDFRADDRSKKEEDKMTKFEYHTEEVPDSELSNGVWEKQLNELGEEGWELVVFSMDVSLGANSFATLKRMVEAPSVVTKAFVTKVVEEGLSKILKALEPLQKAVNSIPAVPAPKTIEEPPPKSETTADEKSDVEPVRLGEVVPKGKVLLMRVETKPPIPKSGVEPTPQKLPKVKPISEKKKADK